MVEALIVVNVDDFVVLKYIVGEVTAAKVDDIELLESKIEEAEVDGVWLEEDDMVIVVDIVVLEDDVVEVLILVVGETVLLVNMVVEGV